MRTAFKIEKYITDFISEYSAPTSFRPNAFYPPRVTPSPIASPACHVPRTSLSLCVITAEDLTAMRGGLVGREKGHRRSMHC